MRQCTPELPTTGLDSLAEVPGSGVSQKSCSGGKNKLSRALFLEAGLCKRRLGCVQFVLPPVDIGVFCCSVTEIVRQSN